MDWQPIETAPKDGTRVWVRRVHEGATIKEGWAVWCTMHEQAPMRRYSYGGLDGPITPDHEFADTPRWLNEDRFHAFPTPTHWAPNPAATR